MLSFDNLGNLGRLGNQMFQYAALKGIARNRKFDFCIPAKQYIEDNIQNVFKFKCNKLITNNFSTAEPHFHFSEKLFNTCENDVNLFGYFQSEKYFANIKEEIRSDFSFDSDTSNFCKRYLKTIHDGSEFISLHIRHGDYQKIPHIHPMLDVDYYEKALSFYDKTLPVLVFSDDRDWCKSVFKGDRFFIQKGDTKTDLCLMSLCNHHIIANSTYSWWGAWLSKSTQVIAPKTWFSPSITHDTSDLYCPSWNLI